MKSKFTLIATAFALAAALPACQTGAVQDNETAQATLLWTGEIAADGCGFEVVMDGRKYIPENEAAIADSFKQSGSNQVQIEFVRLPEPIDRRCGMLPQPRVMHAIQVISIKQL
jgi:hypothetical protein